MSFYTHSNGTMVYSSSLRYLGAVIFNGIKVFALIICLLICNQAFTQEAIDDSYWETIGQAGKHYDNEEYAEAAKLYELAWTKDHVEGIANHRLYAAAANCMIDNEKGVKENLFALIPMANTTDRKRVLVNYQIFNKFYSKDWWTELSNQLNQRIDELIAHHKNLHIFKKGRTLRYSAIRVNVHGDTVANTFINIVPDGTGWGSEAASSQSQVIFEYEYTKQDSVDHIGELDSIIDIRFWSKLDTTGIVENDKKVWMHPFRNNEFFKTELAPFPGVGLPVSEESVSKQNGRTEIMSNWGTYSPSTTYTYYDYEGEELRYYTATDTINCHRISAFGINSVYGESNIRFYFNKDYGFTEMHYDTYDGDMMHFELVGILD